MGNIWWPFSLKDRFRPSKVTFITYLKTKAAAVPALVRPKDTSRTFNTEERNYVALQRGDQGNLET